MSDCESPLFLRASTMASVSRALPSAVRPSPSSGCAYNFTTTVQSLTSSPCSDRSLRAEHLVVSPRTHAKLASSSVGVLPAAEQWQRRRTVSVVDLPRRRHLYRTYVS